QLSDIVQIAKTGWEQEPKVRSFFVGFNLGQGDPNLKEMAIGGGTGKPFLIDQGDIGAQFMEAMLSISSTQLQCDFDVPKPTDPKLTIDPNLVTVRYTPNATKVPEDVLKLGAIGDCSLNGNQGWFYDIPDKPTKIMMCPGTCAKFAAGSVQTISGCKPVP